MVVLPLLAAAVFAPVTNHTALYGRIGRDTGRRLPVVWAGAPGGTVMPNGSPTDTPVAMISDLSTILDKWAYEPGKISCRPFLT